MTCSAIRSARLGEGGDWWYRRRRHHTLLLPTAQPPALQSSNAYEQAPPRIRVRETGDRIRSVDPEVPDVEKDLCVAARDQLRRPAARAARRGTAVFLSG